MSKIQLYSLATPNGQKIGIALEEMDIPYETHTIDISKGDQFNPDFVKISPNSKIPVIVDPRGPDGYPMAVFESGAILIYLAQKYGKFLPTDARLKSETLQWLFFQVGSVGPMLGQFGHFHKYAPEKVPYAMERYKKEVKRLLGVLEARLDHRSFLVGNEYTIADMATVPWVLCLDKGYGAREILGMDKYPCVNRWVEKVVSRPRTAKGLKVCGLD